MTDTNDRIYVLDHAHPSLHRHVLDTEQGARTMHDQVPGTLRVFTEEKPWVTDRAPDSPRTVQAVYAPGWPTGPRPRLITAVFGSEGVWVAEDHDWRRTCLKPGTVLAWRDLVVPSFPAGTEGMHFPSGWR